MTDELTPDDDAALSALYREASDDAEPPGEWSSLRDMIGAARASGFDEEPSPRIDALLMAAARQHAPAPRAPWWARLAAWMKPVVLHPAMAGAAALVVVAGAAGVMYRRGDGEVARPAPPPERAPVAKRDDERPTIEQREQGEQLARDLREQQQPAAPEPVATVTLADPVAPVPRVEPKPGDRKVAPSGGAAGKPGRLRDSTAVAAGSAGQPAEDDDRGGQAAPRTDTFNGPPATDDAVAAPPPPPPPPPPSPRPAQTAPTNEEAAQPRVPDAIASDLPERSALLRDARAAARRGDCTSVTSMSARVRALDAAYHRDVFVRDPDIAACLVKKP